MEESAGFRRRVGQFRRYIEPMYGRSHVIAECFCFTVFSKDSPEDRGGERMRKAAKARPLALPTSVGAGGNVPAPELPPPDPLDADDREEHPFARWLQFGFSYDYFLMDLPDTVLHEAEAKEILRTREGFFFARDREKSVVPAKDLEDFNPLQKIYRYGQEQQAAEDAAFIFFEVWGLPVDSRLYVSSTAGKGSNLVWESREPFE